MKNILKYIVLSLTLCFGACKRDFIDLAPEGALNAKNYFKTEEEFQQALIGVYGSLRGYAANGWIIGEMRSDNTTFDINALSRAVVIQDRENVDIFRDDATNAQTPPVYYSAYEGISRANLVLDRLADANISQTAKNTITGEAKFLRAFFYFNLVQYYGAVPLTLHEIPNPEQALIPRSPVAEVYDAITADLTDAAAKLPQTVTFPQTGRVTVGAAKTLLANVYMVQKKYDLAEAQLKQVTTLGYALLPDYASVFALNNKNGRESIFEVQYKQGTAEGQYSSFIYDFIPPVANTTVITGVNANTLARASSMNVPTKDLIQAFEPGDKRLDASIGVIEGSINVATGAFVPESLKSIVGYTTPAGKTSRLYTKKYLHAHSVALQTDDNWPVYRYAEVLLLLAEALNEQGKSLEALPYLNQVRGPRTGVAAITQTDQALLRDIIAKERRTELAFENKRWTDLLRTGKAIEVMTAHGTQMKLQNPTIPANAYQVTSNRLLFPIPQSEINLNPFLVQNPGYN